MDSNKALHISKIFGFPVISSRSGELLTVLLSKMGSEAKTGKTILVFTPNPEMVVKSTQDNHFLQALMSSDYNIPDGVGMVYLSALVAKIGLITNDLVIPERITGADLSWDLAKKLSETKGKVFLLGAMPTSNIKAQLKLSQSFSGLKVAGEPGFINIPFDDEKETKRVCDLINKFEPDLLLVAFGQVRQEEWLVKNKDKLKAKVAIGVGGTFDYWSGEKRRVPRWIGDIGLEWFWRLCIEPKRAGRILSAILIFPIIGTRLIFQNRG